MQKTNHLLETIVYNLKCVTAAIDRGMEPGYGQANPGQFPASHLAVHFSMTCQLLYTKTARRKHYFQCRLLHLVKVKTSCKHTL